MNARRVELLEHPRLSAQLVGLERRTARSGKDSIDHAPGGHDDLANAVAGVLVGLDLDRRPRLVQQSDILNDGSAMPLPKTCRYIVSITCSDNAGQTATVYAARMHAGLGPSLLLLDYDLEPIRNGIFRDIAARIRQFADQCRAQGAIAFVPPSLSRHAATGGLPCAEIPKEILPEERLLSAAYHIAAGSVKLCMPAVERARAATIVGALDFRAAENVDDPLRCAALLSIALTLDPQHVAIAL